MDIFSVIKDKGLAAIIEKSAPQLTQMLANIHADQSSIAESLVNIATRLVNIEARQDMHSRVLAQLLTESRRHNPAVSPPLMGQIEIREALHGERTGTQQIGTNGQGITSQR